MEWAKALPFQELRVGDHILCRRVVKYAWALRSQAPWDEPIIVDAGYWCAMDWKGVTEAPT